MDLCIGKLEGRFVNCNVPAVNYYSSSCSVFFSCSSATDYIFSTLAQEIKMDGADTEVCRIICKLGHIHPGFFFFLLYLFCLFIFSFVQGLGCVSGWSQRHTQEHEGGSLIKGCGGRDKIHTARFTFPLCPRAGHGRHGRWPLCIKEEAQFGSRANKATC